MSYSVVQLGTVKVRAKLYSVFCILASVFCILSSEFWLLP